MRRKPSFIRKIATLALVLTVGSIATIAVPGGAAYAAGKTDKKKALAEAIAACKKAEENQEQKAVSAATPEKVENAKAEGDTKATNTQDPARCARLAKLENEERFKPWQFVLLLAGVGGAIAGIVLASQD